MSGNSILSGSIKFSESDFRECQIWLASYGLTPVDVQTIRETVDYRQPHIDVKTLEKKLPKSSHITDDPEKIVKKLAHPSKGFLEIYPKKEELCFSITKLGKFVYVEMNERNYSEIIDNYYDIEKYMSSKKQIIYWNPHNIKKGNKITSRDGHGNTIFIKITNIQASNEICIDEGDAPIYEPIVDIEIIGCPRCKNRVKKTYQFNLDNFYPEPIEIKCSICNLTFKLYRYLYYYTV